MKEHFAVVPIQPLFSEKGCFTAIQGSTLRIESDVLAYQLWGSE